MSKEILNVSNLCVSFSDKPVFSDFSLTLERGDKIVVSGPNGCGKTTLLKCILGEITGNSGKVEVSTDNIAYCKQDFPNASFPISVREVVEMGLYKTKSKNKDEVLKAMTATGIGHLADRAYYSLSGGERQRVSLARCFCQKADLLLFDEPSSFLDSDSLESFVRMMEQLPSNISVIIVTHDKILSEKLNWKIVSLGKETDK